MLRETVFRRREIDEDTIKDLFCILYEQTSAAYKVSEALSIDFEIPQSHELLQVILDAMGAPDGDDFREPFFDLFYTRFVIDDEFEDIHAFFKEFKWHFDDHISMYHANK